MNIVNKRGPNIEPWGTPKKRGSQEDEACPSVTEKNLFNRLINQSFNPELHHFI